MQIGPAALDHPAQRIGPVLVPLLIVERQVIIQVGHRKTVAQTNPEIVGLDGQVDRASHCRCWVHFVNRQGVVDARGVRRGQHGQEQSLAVAVGKNRGGNEGRKGNQCETGETFDQRQNVAIMHRARLLPRNGVGREAEV
jgi:hypothetical protein